jgi:hypothetical protein
MPIRRSRRFAGLLIAPAMSVVTLGLVSTPGALVATAQSGATSSPASSSALVPADPSHLAPPFLVWKGTSSSATAHTLSCTQLLAQIANHPSRGSAVCETRKSRTQTPSRSQLVERTGSPTGSGIKPNSVPVGYSDDCAVQDVTNSWLYYRNADCIIVTDDLWETHNLQTGALEGTASYSETYASGYDAYSPVFNNFDSFYMTSESGPPEYVPDILEQVQNSCLACGATNVTYPFSSPTVLPYQKAVYATDNLADNPAAGVVHNNLQVAWQIIIGCSGCSENGYETFTFPLAVRCDFQSGVNGYAGCVVPAYIPTLPMTGYQGNNTSTAFVAFMQANNVDHWGRYPSGGKLLRLNNSTQTDKNRAAMCAGFVALNSSDSCDEFPFAATYESGNMLGYTASQCSQIAVEGYSSVSGWVYVEYPGYSASQHCGIGHDNINDNSTAGGWYGNLIQTNRLLDKDPFWVGIYN